ncbi:hypothetical protein E1B28_009362 [Marasmius oreades]|uniref:Uncharacterized protein n=1 Tax=Marasmius oreades TaxID=181124 RepID=A0A9P7S0G7_9AGAR|nr:uncharacterized protein E1B28_009362 [Marasmius oreades]KAG7093072.1 hypothetical protein E1B28_009362 [Marasmius oreades]
MDPPPAPVAPATKEPMHIPTGLHACIMYLNEHQKEKAVWEEWDKYCEAEAAYEAEMKEWMVEDLAYRERLQ